MWAGRFPFKMAEITKEIVRKENPTAFINCSILYPESHLNYRVHSMKASIFENNINIISSMFEIKLTFSNEYQV
jgi:hypothetical protein